MRPSIFGVLFGLIVMSAPASAASRSDHADCNSNDADRNLVGCTRIIEDASEKRNRAIAYNARGGAWSEKGNHHRAVADYTAALKVNPTDVLALNNRARSQRFLGNIDRALADYSEAIRINPFPHVDIESNGRKHLNIYANRGLAWLAKNDLDRAIADFDEALRFDPSDCDAYYGRAKAWQAQRNVPNPNDDMLRALGASLPTS